MKIYAYIAILALIIGLMAGIYEAGKESERVKQLRAYTALELKLENQRIEYEKATNSLALAVLNRKPERVIQYETIIKQVKVVIPDSRSCDLYSDGIGLLERAREGLQKGESTSQPVDESATASQGGVIRTAIKWARQYNELKDSHNALIDVVKRLECVTD